MKKYAPSGYQIININVTGKESGTPFTPESEDEKLLVKILKSDKEIKKPILLNLVTPSGTYSGLCVMFDGFQISLRFGLIGIQVIEQLQTSGDKLIWTESKE